jgi:hypothetical protein
VGNYGKAPERLTKCLCCGASATPGPFVVTSRMEENDLLIVIGYFLANEFYTCAWQLAEVEGEWTHNEVLADCEACVSAWNQQIAD